MHFSRRQATDRTRPTSLHVRPTVLWCVIATLLLSAPLATGVGTPGDAGAVAEQQAGGRPAFSSRVDLATVNVIVLDRQDVPVGDLTPDDFVVREDGVEHEVALILTPRDTSLRLALAIDISGSMSSSGWEKDVADFLNALSPADCVYFYAFRQDVIPGFWASPGTPGLWDVLMRGEPGRGTGLYDAMIYGLVQLSTTGGGTLLRDLDLIPATQFSQAPPAVGPFSHCSPMDQDAGTWRRRALFVLTDGRDDKSVWYGQEDVAIAANLVRVPIFPVGTRRAVRPSSIAPASLDQPGRLDYVSRRTRSLSRLARMTGGLELGGGRSTLEDLVQRLKGTYVLGYYRNSESDGAATRELVEHEIDVEVQRSGLKVFAQTGYFRYTVDRMGARSAVRTGIDLIAQEQVDAALLAFDQAIQADPLSADGYHQRAIAYSRLERFEEAKDDAMKAAELGPGVGIVHQLAARLSLRLGDHESSWGQAILANRAGSNTAAIFRELREVSDEPPDLEERLGALRVFLWTENVRSVRARAALPKIERQLRQALSRSRSLALVASRDAADLIFSLDVESLDDGRRRRLRGRLQVIDPAKSDPVHESDFRVSDIDDGPRAARELSAYVTELVADIEKALGRDG